jgi:serine/threonine-protein kinase
MGESPTAIMLKHLQEPAPSVLDERGDVPAAVANVVARALAKRPEDRYQTADELVEDFTIAAGMEPAFVSSSAGHEGAALSAGSGSAEFDGLDEETLVRKRLTTPMVPPPLEAATPSPASSFDPWKILLPSVIGLLLIFGVIYAFTRNPQPGADQPGSTLVADPNSQPVEPAPPATGQSEAGIPAGGLIEPTGSPNAAASPSPSPAEQPADGAGLDPNANANTNENTNTRKNPPLPTPVPTRTVFEDPPVPSPAATKAPAPKPTAAAPGATPPGDRQ